MATRIPVTLHEVVLHFDAYADAYLRRYHGMSFSHFRFLTTLAELGTSSVTELAECLIVSKAAVSKRVPELVEDGWMVTSGDPGNARRVMLDLTPKAWAVVEAAGSKLDADFTAMLGQVPGLDAERLNAQLNAINEILLREVAR
jgi:DNA-binding MarR family transcriptional regulator